MTISSNRTAAMVSRLRAQWPKAFTSPPKPLCIGVTASILAQVRNGGNCKTRAAVTSAMEFWTQQTSYLEACTLGATRVNLEGNPLGTVTELEAQYAAHELSKRQREESRAQE
jgi:ProP effector